MNKGEKIIHVHPKREVTQLTRGHGTITGRRKVTEKEEKKG